jgi:hypothetical protein
MLNPKENNSGQQKYIEKSKISHQT